MIQFDVKKFLNAMKCFNLSPEANQVNVISAYSSLVAELAQGRRNYDKSQPELRDTLIDVFDTPGVNNLGDALQNWVKNTQSCADLSAEELIALNVNTHTHKLLQPYIETYLSPAQCAEFSKEYLARLQLTGKCLVPKPVTIEEKSTLDCEKTLYLVVSFTSAVMHCMPQDFHNNLKKPHLFALFDDVLSAEFSDSFKNAQIRPTAEWALSALMFHQQIPRGIVYQLQGNCRTIIEHFLAGNNLELVPFIKGYHAATVQSFSADDSDLYTWLHNYINCKRAYDQEVDPQLRADRVTSLQFRADGFVKAAQVFVMKQNLWHLQYVGQAPYKAQFDEECTAIAAEDITHFVASQKELKTPCSM